MEQGGRIETWISVQLLQQVRTRRFKTETWWEGAQVLFLTGEDCVVRGMGGLQDRTVEAEGNICAEFLSIGSRRWDKN